MDDKWIFYLTLFLVLSMGLTSTGFIQGNPVFKTTRGTFSQQAVISKAPIEMNNVALMNGGR